MPGHIISVHIAGLDAELHQSLAAALESLSCRPTDTPQPAQIVFTGWDPREFSRRAAEFPGKPIVVVSRSADVSTWLDALEAGAADYCAPPFEAIQIRWILDALLTRKSRSAAA